MSYQIRRPLTVDEKNALSEYSDILGHLLFHRGITESESAKTFLSPNYDLNSHDPFLLKGAKKAAERVIQAIKNNEMIAIFADYDADGIPGAALFDDFLRRIDFKNYTVYIPHRHNEGFGLNEDAVRQLHEEGAKLIITIDCGITDVRPVEVANKLGMEVIITDHHEPPVSLNLDTSTPPISPSLVEKKTELPPAFAVIDHKQTDCQYPDKNLCGSGVAYKLIQAILKIDRLGLKEGHEKWLLDLVGIATLSDMVPLVGENRVFAHYGLMVLRQTPRHGLVKLFQRLKMNQRNLSEDDIAFMVTPRINAASRMGVPKDAFDLLASRTEEEASAYAKHLDAINNERKGIVAALTKEIKKTVKERHGESVPSVIVLGNPSWRPALLGLAANSCAEEFDRPVFLWGRDGDNLIKGSCRSEGRTHMVELMRKLPAGMLSQFGGHKFSGGFSVDNDQIHYLENKLNDAAELLKSELKDSNLSQSDENYIDAQLILDDVNLKLYDDINKMAPFGVGNPKPIFLFKSVVPKSIRLFGKTNDHIEIFFAKNDGKKISAISFFGGSSKWAQSLKAGVPIDLIASLEKSTFMNKTELKLRVVDVLC